jgi:hypothetical protein
MVMSMPRAKQRVVWGAVERKGKVSWTPVGYAWEAADGRVDAQLSAFPMSGRISIRGTDDDVAEAAIVVEEAIG